MRGTLAERFDAMVSPEPNTGCWLWTGNVNAKGYGRMRTDGQHGAVPAHRVAYELFIGPIPQGLEIDHLCRVRCCVNPDHLEAVTSRTNTLRGDGPSAIAVRRPTCRHGHPVTDPKDVYRGANGSRVCRLCAIAATSRYIRRKRARSS